MNETYKKLLLGGLSIAIILAGVFLVIRPTMEDTKAIQKETSDLKQYLSELQEKEAKRDEYIAGTASNYAMFDEKLAEFPSDLNQEYQIEYIQGIRNNPDINYDVHTLGMIEPMAFYVLGGGGTEAAAAVNNAVSNPDAAADAVADAEDKYSCYTASMTLEYSGDYAGIKSFVDYTASYAYRMTVDQVTVEESSDVPGLFEGTMTVNVYCISGKGREENADIDLNDIDTGVDNLFTSGSSNGVVSKYAADNGAAIVSDYDLYMAINPTSSDTSGKIVGLKAGGANVTSDKNESEAVTISVSKENDTYVVEYSIGSEKQRQEFDPGEDLTLLIQSSNISDEAADQNRVVVSLENSSDKTLYVKIADDATANRVKIANRAGNISVYK